MMGLSLFRLALASDGRRFGGGPTGRSWRMLLAAADMVKGSGARPSVVTSRGC